MAFRTWARLLPVTLGMAALAAAGQLGLAYGLGIVQLTQVLDVTARDQWTAQLAWVAWFAMNAAVAGAIAGARWLARSRPSAALNPAAPPTSADGSPGSAQTAGGRWAEPATPGAGTVIALALAAGLGAAVVVALTMQPARAARVAGVDPDVVIGICAGLGAVVGVLVACAALARAVARWSLAAVGAVVWLVALVSVAPSLAPGRPLSTVRLGVFEPGWLPARTAQHMALVTMPVLALLVGLGVGWAARRTGRSTLTIALAGLPGPALLTVAYLIAGPGTTSEQTAPYWAAMTAAGAGVLGSVLAAVLRRDPMVEQDDTEAAADRPSGSDGADPDAGRPATPGKSAKSARSAKSGGPAASDGSGASGGSGGSGSSGSSGEAGSGSTSGRKRGRQPVDPGPDAATPAGSGRRSNFADAFRPRPRRPEPPSTQTGDATSGGAPRHGQPDDAPEPRTDGRQRRGRSRAKDTTPARGQDTTATRGKDTAAQAKGVPAPRGKDNDYVDWVSGLGTD
ncbi:hypothetical protein [Krasilnikovia sp. MM14-A1004]|uniref:hypothetical protein n=1 Tax=Krasilnikovia sp. MM14-A1004 TaxID=3373541 RepID=UPI00399D22D3